MPNDVNNDDNDNDEKFMAIAMDECRKGFEGGGIPVSQGKVTLSLFFPIGSLSVPSIRVYSQKYDAEGRGKGVCRK